MSRDRMKGRRAFRPELGGQRLEPRLLMKTTPLVTAQYLLTHPALANAYKFNDPAFVNGSKALPFPLGPQVNKGKVDVQTARGGASLIVATPDGGRFRVTLELADDLNDGTLSAETATTTTANVVPSSVVQATGTVRAYPMPGGEVGIIVDGNTSQEQLEVDPLPFAARKGYANSFAYAEGSRTHMLEIGSLQINGPQGIQAILGNHDADLDGALSIASTNKVDRIAFNSLQPGASIAVPGTLNTLDIANGATLTAGPGITIGGDLNLLNVGQNLTLANGASLTVGRFIGATPQPAKGTSTGSNILSLNQSTIGTGTATLTPSVSGYIQGNVIVGPGSVFNVTSGIASSSATITGAGTSSASPTPLLINGSLNLFSGTVAPVFNPPTNFVGVTIVSPQFIVPNNILNNQLNSQVNLVTRNGLFIGGAQIAGPG
jgi:hypothetical protein